MLMVTHVENGYDSLLSARFPSVFGFEAVIIRDALGVKFTQAEDVVAPQ